MPDVHVAAERLRRRDAGRPAAGGLRGDRDLADRAADGVREGARLAPSAPLLIGRQWLHRAYAHEEPAGDDNAAINVFTKDGDTVRHFWGEEMGPDTADPGQDPRGAPDPMPLWTILDLTPEGRGTDWYPKLEYGAAQRKPA